MEQDDKEFDAIISNNNNYSEILIKKSKSYYIKDGYISKVYLILKDDYENNLKVFAIKIFTKNPNMNINEFQESYTSNIYKFANKAIEKYDKIIKILEEKSIKEVC